LFDAGYRRALVDPNLSLIGLHRMTAVPIDPVIRA